MTRKIGLLAAWVLIVLGLLHAALTIPNYGSLTVDALWFAGSGLMLVSAGLLNLAVLRARGGDRGMAWATAAVDVMGGALAVASVMVIREPQTYALVALFVAALVGVLGRNGWSDSRRA